MLVTHQYGSATEHNSFYDKLGINCTQSPGTGTLNEIDGQQGLKCTQLQNNNDSVKLTWSNITQTHIEARVCTALGQQESSQMFEVNTAEFDNVTVSLSNEIAGGSDQSKRKLYYQAKNTKSWSVGNTATPRF